MADTDWNAFSDVTSLLATDMFVAARSGGGINFTLATLFGNVPDLIQSGLGVSTGPVAFEHGAHRTGNGDTFFDLHSTPGSDFDARIWRGAGANGSFDLVSTGTGGILLNSIGTGRVRFATSNIERAAIDHDGNVAIGGSASVANGLRYLDIYNTDNGSGAGSDIRLITRNNADSATIASDIIKYKTGGLVIMNGETTSAGFIGFGLGGAEKIRIDSAGALRPSADNTWSLGTGPYRFSVVYAATGTINTSDEREKDWRGGATEPELRAARRMIDELGFFQWKDAVAEKGPDGARFHFGVRAQRAWAIMAEEGLVDSIGEDGRPGATTYAFLCFDAWDDAFEPEMKVVKRKERVPVEDVSPSILGRDGKGARKVKYRTIEHEEQVPTGKQILVRPAGNRYGVRTDQLTLFLLAAQAARQDAIETRLAALEGKQAA